MKLIRRDTYLNKLINVIGTPDIKVITGIRRSGKSKLMEAFKDYVKNNIEDFNIVHINFNLPQFEKLMEYHELYNYIEGQYIENKNNFVLIDEVQMCTNFEKAINGLHAEEKFDLYITGSNAFLLSSDLATLFTGRTFEVKVFPFSFEEYLRYYGHTDIQESFEKYLLHGGMAGSYVYKTDTEKYDYIEDIYDTLIARDIKKKYNIRNMEILNNVNKFLIDNISNLTSSNNITDNLNINNYKVTYKTINNYMEYLCNAFAFYKIARYDIRGKKYLKTLNKYYLADHSFKYALLGKINMDYGRVYENIVAIELLRRGYKIYIGTLYKKEIDFVAMKRDEKIYIQVSDDISNDKTFAREVEPLLKIKDAYPKMLIANTKHDSYSYEGIEIFDIAKWLLQKNEKK